MFYVLSMLFLAFLECNNDIHVSMMICVSKFSYYVVTCNQVKEEVEPLMFFLQSSPRFVLRASSSICFSIPWHVAYLNIFVQFLLLFLYRSGVLCLIDIL